MTAIQHNREEFANSLTHALGAVASLAGLVLLVTFSWTYGDGWHVASTAVFGVSLVVLYTASALYHGVRNKRWRQLFFRLDYAGIFLLIAGTYTPFLVLHLRGVWGWSLLTAVWALCVTGMVLVFRHRFPWRSCVASTLFYLTIGWLVIAVMAPLSAMLPTASLRLLLAGGMCYTVGTVFFHLHRLPYHHTIWHVFVLAGSACHWVAVFGYGMPGKA